MMTMRISLGSRYRRPVTKVQAQVLTNSPRRD